MELINAIAGALVFFGITCIAIGLCIIGSIWFLTSSNEIRSNTIMKPIRKELLIKNNIVDTVYIYKKP